MNHDYLNIISVSEEIISEKAKLKGWKWLVAEVLKVFSPLMWAIKLFYVRFIFQYFVLN